METPPRVAVFGLFGHGNLGNEATLAAFLASMRTRMPSVEVSCATAPEADLGEYGTLHVLDMRPMDVRVPLRKRLARLRLGWLGSAAHRATEPLQRAMVARKLRGVDALIVVGTGILDDYAQGPLDLPYDLLRWCWTAELMSIPVAFTSVGAEPIDNRETREYLRRAAALAAHRSFRDTASRINAQHLGVDTRNDAVVPDLAFSLPPSALPAIRPIAWPPREIGLGVMGYYGWNLPAGARERTYQSYLANLRRLASWLVDQGHTVRLLLGDTRDDQRPIRDLVQFFKDRGTSESDHFIAEPIDDFQGLLKQINQTDLVIGTRFHNVLFALLLERPAMSISYSKKNDSLLAEYRMNEYSQHAESLDPERFAAGFRALSDKSNPCRDIRLKNETYRRRLGEEYDRLFLSLFPEYPFNVVCNVDRVAF